jgi:hypothetical protein
LAAQVVERFAGKWIGPKEKRCRVVGIAERGGVRIDGGPEGFRDRTVSLVDLARVLVARDDVEAKGGVLNEARVKPAPVSRGDAEGSDKVDRYPWAILIVSAVSSS